ncbi:MAG TPA: PHP domain-containing protein [Acidimicrobiales bacterium]|nr:PHP domain-containing protein [Acidimicrobiales bacterium]
MIDLHTHTTVSDGSDPPAAIPGLAAAAGCTAVALTDHDSLDGLAEARGTAESIGIELVPGCELSCETEGQALHLLVYFVDLGDGPLQDELGRLRDIRDERNRRMVEALVGLGLPVTWDELQAEAGGTGAGRPHAAAVLVRKGVVASVQEAFDVWLAKGRPAYVEKERLSPATAIELALASGGVPVLAHPLTLGRGPDLSSAVDELATLGLVGLEAWYGRYEPEEREMLAGLAGEHGLVATGGSDHHGTYKPDLSVGVGRGDLSVPDQCLEDLRDRIPT